MSVPPIITSSHRVQTNGLSFPFSSRQNNSSFLLFMLSCTYFTGLRFSMKLPHCRCTAAVVFIVFTPHAVLSITTITIKLLNIIRRLRNVYSLLHTYRFPYCLTRITIQFTVTSSCLLFNYNSRTTKEYCVHNVLISCQYITVHRYTEYT
jgi:hypothetical protein